MSATFSLGFDTAAVYASMQIDRTWYVLCLSWYVLCLSIDQALDARDTNR
jgi:hypothetical protein